ncbi:MAG: hypothetical protein HYR94_17135 [Chloroflexi bacterium]|nr:hypothetical protein [Chloroflexota bacterium]
MKKIDHYRQTLKTLEDWDVYLLKESGLPGPRGNLELAQAVAAEGTEPLFERWLELDASKAPTNTPGEFLAFCGVVGLGRLLTEGKTELLERLRQYAADPRWRIREGVALALQRLGEQDMDALLRAMEPWSRGSPLEQRAAAAALCEPKLLVDAGQIKQVLQILDDITASLERVEDRKSEAFKALRKGLAYCWSVAVVALPAEGQQMMERWLVSDDRDISWIMQENLKKQRLTRMDAAWVEKWRR